MEDTFDSRIRQRRRGECGSRQRRIGTGRGAGKDLLGGEDCRRWRWNWNLRFGCRRGGNLSGSRRSPRRRRSGQGGRGRVVQAFGTAESPVHIGRSNNPAFDSLQIRDRRFAESNVRLLAVISLGAGFALARKVKAESLAAGQLRAMADIVGNEDHSKVRVPMSLARCVRRGGSVA